MSLNNFNHFNYPPSLSILRQLVAPASLIDNVSTVLKAVRFYFLLKKLYEKNPSFDSDQFTLKQLRDFLFKGYEEYHERDKTPNHIALDCLCNQTLAQLLFPEVMMKDKWDNWKDNFLQTYSTLKQREDLEHYLSNVEKGQPFQVTLKKIGQDLDELVERGWLKKVDNSRPKKYQKLSQLPLLKEEAISQGTTTLLAISNDSEDPHPFVSDDFSSFTYLFCQPINGVQRFHLHADYQTPSSLVYKICELQTKLKEIWAMSPVPLVDISYISASLGNEKKQCLIYPICIHYYQRWFYLCGFGRTPKDNINWYNYRLDRIEDLNILSWDDSRISNIASVISRSLEMYRKSDSESQNEDNEIDPLISHIHRQFEEAYGLDFYQDRKEMLLRFPHNFHKSYIENTLRHHSFKKIPHQEAINRLKKSSFNQNKPQLIQRIENSQKDSFYRLNYRDKDNYVIMRLRAWFPNVEVLLPEDLRQRVTDDLIQSLQHYQLGN